MPGTRAPGHYDDLKQASSNTSSAFRPDPKMVNRMIDEASTYAIHGGAPERGGIGDDPQGCAKAESRLELAGKMAKGLEEGPTRDRVVVGLNTTNAMFRHFCPN